MRLRITQRLSVTLDSTSTRWLTQMSIRTCVDYSDDIVAQPVAFRLAGLSRRDEGGKQGFCESIMTNDVCTELQFESLTGVAAGGRHLSSNRE